jgi:hypothetical protein
MSGVNPQYQILERDKGRNMQSAWSTHWADVARFTCSGRKDSLKYQTPAVNNGVPLQPERHNDTAVHGLEVFSGGLKAWVCPGAGSGWWQWTPHASLKGNNEVADWLADCAQRADGVMENAGFYDSAHSVFEDLGMIGIGCMFIDVGDDKPLSCVPLSANEFVFTVDFEKRPNSARVTYNKTAEEWETKFRDVPGAVMPETLLADLRAKKTDAVHEIIHAVYERNYEARQEAQEYERNPLKMQWASCWIHVASKTVVHESGFDEFPFIIPRWRVMTGTPGLYGISPGMDALASARGVNLMDMLMATQVEVALNPRILAPPGTGTIDLSPGGITQRLPGTEAPSEWLSDGSRGGVQNGENFIVRKESQIMRAFHADLFEQLAPIAQKREMTNGLVEALQRESLSRISPAMGRLSQEFVEPAMLRIFMILYRAGIFALPPDAAFYYNAAGEKYLIFPRVAQTSRMAQALNSRKVWAYRSAVERVLTLSQLMPEVMDIYNWDAMHRDLDRGDGMPTEWHRTEDEVMDLRQARAEAQQQQQQQQMALEMATKQPELAMQAAGMAQAA